MLQQETCADLVDLVDQRGFSGSYQSVKRFIRNFRGKSAPEACTVIETAPGEDYGEFRVMVRTRWRPAFGAGTAAHKTILGAT